MLLAKILLQPEAQSHACKHLADLEQLPSRVGWADKSVPKYVGKTGRGAIRELPQCAEKTCRALQGRALDSEGKVGEGGDEGPPCLGCAQNPSEMVGRAVCCEGSYRS